MFKKLLPVVALAILSACSPQPAEAPKAADAKECECHKKCDCHKKGKKSKCVKCNKKKAAIKEAAPAAK